jgi:hypothetical protein
MGTGRWLRVNVIVRTYTNAICLTFLFFITLVLGLDGVESQSFPKSINDHPSQLRGPNHLDDP